MNAQRVTTCLSYEQYQLCQKNNWKWSDVMKAGISALVKPDVNLEKIQALEAEVLALKRKINSKRTLW